MCFKHPMENKQNNNMTKVSEELIHLTMEMDQKLLNGEITNKDYAQFCYDKYGGVFCLETLCLWNLDLDLLKRILSLPNHIEARNKRLTETSIDHSLFTINCDIRHLCSFITCPQYTFEEVKEVVDLLFNSRFYFCGYSEDEIKDLDKTSRVYYDYLLLQHSKWMPGICHERVLKIVDVDGLKTLLETKYKDPHTLKKKITELFEIKYN